MSSKDRISKPKDPSKPSKSTKKKVDDAVKTAAEAGDDAAKTHHLSLKGSAKLVAEFFDYSIHTILFQRGVYPAEDFAPVKKYGLNMLVSSDDQVKAYVKKIMSALNKWMQGGKISSLVVVISGKASGEIVERWAFDVDILRKRTRVKSGGGDENASAARREGEKREADEEEEAPPTEAEIQSQIQSIFRQITASVTFLPQLDEACTFNVLVYADADSEVPVEWGDSDAKEIEGAEKVVLRSFSTGSHRVGAVVSYRLGE